MPKVSKALVHEYLEELDKETLVAGVLKLYSRFDQIQKYYQMELGGDTEGLVNQYKQKVRAAYFPARGFGDPKASAIRKLLSEFKKIAVFDYDIIDLLLYRVENGVEFTLTYGDIDEPFYASIESSYEEALKLIAKNKLYTEFKDRCKEILCRTQNMGWGFYDTLAASYEEYIGKEID